MAVSKDRREGYLLIDNRCAPPEPGIPRYLEAATSRCGHCERQIIRNPARMRERASCSRCDTYICDDCAIVARSAGCKPFSAVIEEHFRSASNIRIF